MRKHQRLRVIHVTHGLDMGGQEKLLVEFARHAVIEVSCDGKLAVSSQPFADIDTPEQYRAAGG